MVVESLDIEHPDEVKVSNGYFVSKKLIIIVSIIITAVFVCLILGLVLGLENKYKSCDQLAETQKFESCKETGCKNTTFLQCNLILCFQILNFILLHSLVFLTVINDACYSSTVQTTLFSTISLTTSPSIFSTASTASTVSTASTTVSNASTTVSNASTTVSTASTVSSASTPSPITTPASTTITTSLSYITTSTIKVNYRLPKSLKPYFYHITTMTRFDSLTEPQDYNGTVQIDFNVKERTNLVILHHIDLIIDTASIKLSTLGGIENKILYTSYDNETSFFTIHTENILDNNQNYSISMNYIGKLLGNNIGFYKSSYTDAGGKRR